MRTIEVNKIRVNCEYCGNEFTAKRSSAKYCSDNCKAAYHSTKKFFELGGSIKTKEEPIEKNKPIKEKEQKTHQVIQLEKPVLKKEETFREKFVRWYTVDPICANCGKEINIMINIWEPEAHSSIPRIQILKSLKNGELENKIFVACCEKCQNDLKEIHQFKPNDSYLKGGFFN